jgi:FG-GAP-like repeat
LIERGGSRGYRFSRSDPLLEDTVTTTPRLWKSLTQVNTTDGGAAQFDGQIAGLHDGGYVVVWMDDSGTYNPNGTAVVGQRYDLLGNKVGGEVPISYLTSGDQQWPEVTVLANGNIAVAFEDDTGGDPDIYVRVLDPAMNIVRTDTIDTGANRTSGPSITALADGSYAVSYTVITGGGLFPLADVVARIVSPTGVAGGQFDIDNETDYARISRLATLSNGNFVVVYEDEPAPATGFMRYAIFTPAGALVAGPAPVPGGVGFNLGPAAALRDGGFVVVWNEVGFDDIPIHASILSNTGATVAVDIPVNTTLGPKGAPTVVALADGGFLVSWGDTTTSPDSTRAQRFDAAGHKIGAEFTVKDGIASGGDAAVLTDGRIAFALSDTSTGDTDVMTSIWTTGWNAVGTGDFNADGVKDILWQNAIGIAAEWLMSPAGGVANVYAAPLGTWNVIATGDFNGDGTDDILWQNATTGITAQWLMAPTGGVGTMLGTPPAPGWDVVATGDFNNDGTTDVMWKHAASGATAEWLMAPTGGVGTMLSTPLAAGWNLIASGDFSGDGITDIMWQHASSGATAEWLMAPTGGVGAMLNTPLAAGWNLIASGDFSGDGITDLLWQHEATGVSAEWLMAPNGGVATMLNTPPTGGWSLIASGDFNGDGTDDLGRTQPPAPPANG